ncbi:dTMP kinase [Nitrosopumilus adriaticus]|uniref:dTMP kinase n=1 Tax=Nitrosopumilus adriaticus TaxID=1580092 RepID=UPI00352E5F4C
MIIVIEGGDQAGKFTQSTLLEKALKKRKIKTKLFHFPDYKTPIGQEIRKYLDGKRKFPPQVIHCLLAANRWEKLNEIIAAQEKNSILIMNRYYHSNLIYGIANGLKPKWLESLDAGLPKADLVILLDVSQKESFHRQKTNRDKFEKNEEFLQKISKIYRTTAKKKKWKIIDASKSKQEVHEEIMKTFSKKIGL